MRLVRIRRTKLCCHCGAELEPGTLAKVYPDGAIYGTQCHEGPDAPEPAPYYERSGFNRYSREDQYFARRLQWGADLLGEYA